MRKVFDGIPSKSRDPLPVVYFVALLSLVITDYQAAILRRKLAEAASETFHALLQASIRFRAHAGDRRYRFGERHGLARSLARQLPEHHAPDPDRIRGEIVDLRSFGDLPRAAHQGLVGVLVGGGTAAPLEQAHRLRRTSR